MPLGFRASDFPGGVMAEYFLCLDGEMFNRRIRPALAVSWQQRRFDPCLELCHQLLPAARDYADRYHTGEEEPLLARITSGFPFDRACWRLLVGEVLLFAAAEIPELQTNAETLCCLLAPQQYGSGNILREQFAPIQQVLRGSRDLTFSSAVYRPEHTGYNDAAEVARLAEYLTSVRPERWTVEDLRELREVGDDDERADELAFVREWFPALVDLYQRLHAQQRVLVIENIF
jgi:hypothetical protein